MRDLVTQRKQAKTKKYNLSTVLLTSSISSMSVSGVGWAQGSCNLSKSLPSVFIILLVKLSYRLYPVKWRSFHSFKPAITLLNRSTGDSCRCIAIVLEKIVKIKNFIIWNLYLHFFVFKIFTFWKCFILTTTKVSYVLVFSKRTQKMERRKKLYNDI